MSNDGKNTSDCDTPQSVEMVEHAPRAEAPSEKEIARVIRKLDLHIMPLVFILYTFSVLDRSNLGNAKLAGMGEDIDLSENHYQLLSTTFYIAYILFQFTSLGWKLFRPHMWVTFVVFFWGLVSSMQAVCSSWSGLMACRFLLGVAETMFGPGMPLYMSYFYPREYIGLRFGIFLSGASLANAYGGALAYGLSQVRSSIGAWRFLFIVEGVPTAIMAVICWFYFPDSPAAAKFLTPREREIAIALAETQPGDNREAGLDLKSLGSAFTDYKNWLFAMANFSVNVSFASLPLFLPTIISQLGPFTTLQSNGLSAPPYLLCFFLMIAVAFWSDRLRLRGPFAVFFALVSSAGYLMLALSKVVVVRYVGIFLAVTIFSTVATILIWNANTNHSTSKRAGGVWIVQAVGQCGTVLGTNMFPAEEGPYYTRGMFVCFAFSLSAGVICGVLSLALWMENRRNDRKAGEGTASQGVSPPRYII